MPHMPPLSPFTPAIWIRPVGMVILGWAMAGLLGYFHADKTIAQRLTALETHREDDSNRLERLENKLDQVVLAVVK